MDVPDLLRTELHLASLLGEVEEREDHIVVRTPLNPGYYNGNFLLLPGPPEDIDHWIARFEDAFGNEVRHRCLKWAGGMPSSGLLESSARRGFEVDRGVGMSLEAAPEDPEKAGKKPEWTVRPLEFPGEWGLFESLNVECDATERLGSESYALFKRRMRATMKQWIARGHATWWGAFHGEMLIGQCGFLACGDLGRYQAVETHPAFRRRGVCSALMATVARDGIQRLGCRSILLEAEVDGPALGLYRRLGFVEADNVHSLLRGSESMSIRAEVASDHAGVRSLVSAAFEQPDEAALIEELRDSPGVISLVAERSGSLLGQALFSPVRVHEGEQRWSAMALGPVSVRPGQQRQGVGGALIRAGLVACRKAGHAVCFVLGHPAYYPRFGFRPAPPLGLTCKWPVPDEVFMVLELEQGTLAGRTGRVEYDGAFDRL